MKRNSVARRFAWLFLTVVLSAGLAAPAAADITTASAFQFESLDDPAPPAFDYASAIAYYDGKLIYAGSDQKIYTYDTDAKTSAALWDLSADPNFSFGASGFFVSTDNYLYFLDNGSTQKIYRIDLTAPGAPAELDTGADGSIFAFAQNPWTDAIWFASSDFGGPNMYLYRVNAGFNGVTRSGSGFAKPNGGGNGPIIFKGPDTLLYGEAVFGGNGYFHLLNTSTGALIQENYLMFPGGLADSTYGYDNRIYATSGGGKKVLELRGGAAPQELGTSDDEARGIAFGDAAFYISEMAPFGAPNAGAIAFNKGSDASFTPEIAPADPYRAAALSDPNPPAQGYASAIAYYDGRLIYAGNDQKIYAYSLATEASAVLCDLSGDDNFQFGASGFLVSVDDYLYFLDNGSTKKIYRIDLTAPGAPAELDTGANGSIFSLTQNPWTGAIWFASADFGGPNMYLYRVNAGFNGVTQAGSGFAQPNGGGNGPIIFEGPDMLLYGESVFGGDGYFHLVDSMTGELIQQDYLTFSGGLADAAYGFDNKIYATSGGGNRIYEIQGTDMALAAESRNEARGIAFDGASLLVSAMVPFGGANPGKIGFLRLWQTRSSGVPAGQQVDDTVDLNQDGTPDNQQPDVILSVNAADGSGTRQIGVSPAGADVFVESLEAVDPATISETAGRPADLPFGLVNYRLKVTSAVGIARVVVYFSESVSPDSGWYKYDSIDGWTDYSAHATFSANGRSVTLELEDGGFGDADRIVNGEIIDPSGLGTPAAGGQQAVGSSSGGSGGGCFIHTAGQETLSDRQLVCWAIAFAGMLAAVCCFGGLRRKK